ncbi:MAG: hypothetical protein WBD55_07310 [Dehalococcoidia bacterium]
MGAATLDRPRTTAVDFEERHLNGRRIRSDALPEHLSYQDSGCELSPSCLRCPLARCRYDEPGGARRLRQNSRDEVVQRRREEGICIDALASEFRISRRSVFRILARGRVTADAR